MSSHLEKQLIFYGAYHSNRVNIAVHIICVPLLLWSFQVMGSRIPVPSFIPQYERVFNDYLVMNLNFSAIHAIFYLFYYFYLEPMAALTYAPQLMLSLLTATAYSRVSGNIAKAGILHAISWIAQFAGHGLAEKRAPALLDNLLGAVVLAPFFVHLETLFMFGYRPELRSLLKNEIGKEITKHRKAQGDGRRKGI